MIEIEDYDQQPPGKPTIGIFTAYLPAIQMRIRKIRAIKLKTGHIRIGMPSYAIQTDESKFGASKPVFKPYVEFSSERQKDFDQKVLKALEPFLK